MNETVRILQIYQNIDIRRGEIALSRWVDENTCYSKGKMKRGDVTLFLKRKRNIIKVMGARGILSEKLPDKQTWDFKLRKEQLLSLIGRSFGIRWRLSPVVKAYWEGVAKNA
jgi:hypothetical protein